MSLHRLARRLVLDHPAALVELLHAQVLEQETATGCRDALRERAAWLRGVMEGTWSVLPTEIRDWHARVAQATLRVDGEFALPK